MQAAWHGPWLDQRLSHLAVRAWAVLSLSCGTGHVCRFRVKLLARALHVTAEQLEAALEQLVSAGYIELGRDGAALEMLLLPDQFTQPRLDVEVPTLL